jgi:hypothetical protein
MKGKKLTEADLLAPVLRLFPRQRYHRLGEVPLGRKKIDLFCIPRRSSHEAVSVELKLRDWRRALWQATVNLQLADRSYIALYDKYVHRAEAHAELLDSYGVGLIAVDGRRAWFLRHARDRVFRVARSHKPEFYRVLLALAEEQ